MNCLQCKITGSYTGEILAHGMKWRFLLYYYLKKQVWEKGWMAAKSPIQNAGSDWLLQLNRHSKSTLFYNFLTLCLVYYQKRLCREKSYWLILTTVIFAQNSNAALTILSFQYSFLESTLFHKFFRVFRYASLLVINFWSYNCLFQVKTCTFRMNKPCKNIYFNCLSVGCYNETKTRPKLPILRMEISSFLAFKT